MSNYKWVGKDDLMVAMNHFITDLDEDDVADVEKRTNNATCDNISGIALVVF